VEQRSAGQLTSLAQKNIIPDLWMLSRSGVFDAYDAPKKILISLF